MTTRYYANAPSHTIPGGVANGTTTSITVDSVTGWPTQFPFTAIIEPDSVLEEAVDVTAIVGLVLTVTRGVDGTTASAHAAGVKIMHGVIARDLTEANTHINATSNIHGSSGALLDVGSVQTATGAKTLNGATTLGGALNANGVGTFSGNNTFQSGVFLTASSTLQSSDTNVDTQIKGDGTGRMREMTFGRHFSKSANQNTTVTTMANVTDLVFTATANAVYEVDLELILQSNTSASNIKIGWALSSGSFDMTGIGPGSGVTTQLATTSNFQAVRGASAATLLFGMPGNSTDTPIRCKARIAVGVTGGNCNLQFAQNLAGGTSTMMASSWMTVRRVA